MTAIFYGTFVVVLVSIVVWSTTVKVDLVADDYYDQEIKYQEQIDKIVRTKALNRQLHLERTNSTLVLGFPNYMSPDLLSGKISFYRPSDKELDFYTKVNVDTNNTQSISTKSLKSGLWKIKVDWAASDTTFYNEFDVVLD